MKARFIGLLVSAASPAWAQAPAPAVAEPPPVAQPAPTQTAPEAAPAAAPPPVAQPAPTDAATHGQAPVTENLTPEADPEQAKMFVGGQWDVIVPTGSTTDFVGSVSPAGASLDVRFLGLGEFSLGVFGAWHTLSEKSEKTLVQDNITLSGTQVRTLYVNPLYARFHYSLRDIRKAEVQGMPTPYVAFNVGGARAVQRVDMGISAFSRDSWQWALAPELGAQLPIKKVVVTASARFNYLFSAADGDEQMYFTFSLGVGAF